MTDGFWSNPNKLAVPQSLLTLNSVGDRQTGPTGFIPGTSAGAIPDKYSSEAQAVYPWGFNYSEAARKAEYDDLRLNKLSQFSSWHSLYQAEYITYNASGIYAIPSQATGLNPPAAAYIVSTDGRTVINIMNLTVADYQRLSARDKDKLEGYAYFTQMMARTLGLVDNASSGLDNKINLLRNEINGISTPNSVPPADRDIFLAQLDILKRRLDESRRVVVGNFENEIGTIAERFKRIRAFASQQPEVGLKTVFQGFADEKVFATLNTDVKGFAISSDNGATVKTGYTNLMRTEREMLTAQLRREALTRNVQIFDPKNDVAQLIYQLQLQYQSEADARSDAGTEEMAQLHRLLSDYAIMQRLINETLKAYNPKDQNEKRRFMNLGAKGDPDRTVDTDQTTWDEDPIRIIYMFDNGRRYTLGTGEKTNGEDQFAEGPGYHWFLLAGSPGNSRIGDGIIYQYGDKIDPGIGRKNFMYDSDKFGPPDGNPNGEVYNYFTTGNQDVVVKTGGLSEAEMRVVGMFSKDPWGSGDPSKTENTYAGHPIELLYGVDTRPLSLLSDDDKSGFGSLRLERRDYWDKWGTQLADTVTILNQKNQLKQSEIDSASKESNRHFDLGNNALRKMNEMLMSIGRM